MRMMKKLLVRNWGVGLFNVDVESNIHITALDSNLYYKSVQY